MSDVSGGPGWWIATDGQWYPPHLHPDYQPPSPPTSPAPVAPPPAQATPPAQAPVGLPQAIPTLQQPEAPWGQSPQPTRIPRRTLVIALGVVAVLVVAGILAAVLSGGGSSAPFADGTPNGEGFVCANTLYLSWTTSGGQIHGIAVSGLRAFGQEPLTGTQSGDRVTLDIAGGRTTGQLTTSSLILDDGAHVSVTCTLKTRAQFEAGGSRTGTGSAVSPSDRATQSNIVNALTAAKAQFVNSQSYGSTDPLVAQLEMAEPSLQFTARPSTGQADMSVLVAPNGQSVLLAARSSTGRCWYAVDNEQATTAPGLPASAPPGVSYDASPSGATQATCSAQAPVTATPWSTNFPA